MALYHEDIANIDLENGNIYRSFMNHSIGYGDDDANRFGIRAYRNGVAEGLGGTCAGYFIRADGETVVIADGVVSGNLAYVTLPEACYAVEGNFTLAIKVSGSGVTGTMRIVDGVVSRTSTDVIVDPGTIIPSIEDLIEAINEAVASIPADYSQLTVALSEYNARSGLYIEKLTSNQLYPYIDIEIDAKAGESVVVSLDYYSDVLSNLVRWYAYNPATSQTIITPLSKTNRQYIVFNTDVQTIRFIFQTSTEVDNIIVGFHCYKPNDKKIYNVIENKTVSEYVISATTGSNVIQYNIPFIADIGDLLEVEVIDNNGVLTKNNRVSIGYYSDGTQVSDVLRILSPYTKGIGKIEQSCDIDTLTVYISSEFISASGDITIRYKNLTKMGIDAPKEDYRTFSILGDSYSTFVGFTNPTTNRQWYPTNDSSTQGYGSGNDVIYLSKTWWYLFAKTFGCALDENASYSGSTICYDSYGTGTSDGKTTSFIQRRASIGNPELLFIFGGTNDNWAGASIGEYKYSGWTEADLSYFAPALAYLIYNLMREHIGMKIVFIENDALSSSYKTAIETVCANYSVPVLKLSSVAKIHDHPSNQGMEEIANQLYKFMLNRFPMYF